MNWQRVRSGSLALQNNTNIDQKTRNKKKTETKKTKKKRLHTPRAGVVAESRVLSFCFLVFFFFLVSCCSGFLVFWFLVFLAIAEKTNNELENKKPQNQEPPQKKTRLHTPRGGVVAESWVLSFVCCFFCFFVFWFCLAIAEKTNRNYRNCQWLQSSERTMAHVQCQWF